MLPEKRYAVDTNKINVDDVDETNKIVMNDADETKPAAGRRTSFSRFRRWVGKRVRAIVVCGGPR